MTSTRMFSIVVSCLLASLICGCGSGGGTRPAMGKVKGTVTYKGKPVSGAVVSLFMEGASRGSSGTTDESGNYKLTTFDTNDGAFVGTNKVTVTKPKAAPLGKDPKELTPDDLLKITREGKINEMSAISDELPAKYADVKTSKLQLTIEAGDNQKEIELED